MVVRGAAWAYDLLQPLTEVANPAQDSEGLTLDRRQGRERARAPKGLDNDF